MNPHLLCALGAAVLWGLAQVLGKRSVAVVSIGSFNAVRECTAFVFAAIFLATEGAGWSGVSQVLRQDPGLFIEVAIIAIVGSVLNLVLLYGAIREGTVATVVVALCACPVLVFCACCLDAGARLTPRLAAGMALSLLSLFVLARTQDAWSPGRMRSRRPLVLALLSGACQAASIVGNRHLAPRLDDGALLFLESGIAAITFLGLAGKELGSLWRKGSARAAVDALLSGVTGRGVGILLLLIALRNADPVAVALLGNTSMFFAMAFAALLLGERVTRGHLVSSVVGFVGATLVLLA